MNYSLSTNRIVSVAVLALLVGAALFLVSGKAEASVNRSAVAPSISGLPYFKTLTVTASPRSIVAGDISEISWNAPEAASCRFFTLTLGNNDMVSVSPSQTTTYTVTCTGGQLGKNTVKESVTVTVTAASPKLAKPAVLKTSVRK